ncbi:MAG: polysaccharide ABC transporter ATP-binding protein [Actinomycetota bacterium]
MLPDGSIEVTNIWKRFRKDRKGALIKDQIRRLRARMQGRDPGWQWALRDINFSVEPGESVGVVGANGSGKTTLLRILSGVMYPYAGRIEVNGRVGALIEVRAGLHPELSGRENIFVYGTLLGLKRRSVAKRFDDIVQFAGLEEAVDRQLKHYSSGMQMRLGFAVAAFLDPAILMVDEILAVGDAAFQQRCLERMREVQSQGTTLLFVSHDLATVEATCARSIWLSDGVKAADGRTPDVLAAYRTAVEQIAAFASPKGGPFEILDAKVSGGGDDDAVRTQGPVDIQLALRRNLTASGGAPDSMAQVVLGVTEGPATPIFLVRHQIDLSDGTAEVTCRIPRLPLPRGRYYVWVAVWQRTRNPLAWHPVARFDVEGQDLDWAPRSIVRLAPVHVETEWKVAANGHLTSGMKTVETANPPS